MQLLKSLGIDVETIKVEPLQVTDTHFSDRIPGIDEATSTQIVQVRLLWSKPRYSYCMWVAQ